MYFSFTASVLINQNNIAESRLQQLTSVNIIVTIITT